MHYIRLVMDGIPRKTYATQKKQVVKEIEE